MTATYSEDRYRILRDVAQGDPKVGVTAPPVIDRLFAEGLLKQRGLAVVLTLEGTKVYMEWETVKACGRLPGVEVKRARGSWRCAAHRQLSGHNVTIHAPGKPAQSIGIEGAGGDQYIAELRRNNPTARIHTTPIPNTLHVPDCDGVIPAGDQYATWQGRRLHIRCCLARINPTPDGGTR